MDAVAAFVQQSGILWALLIVLGLLVGSWLVVIYWENRISRALQKYPPELDQIQEEVKKILGQIQSYSAEDPLPYGPIVSGIHRQVDSIANRLASLKLKFNQTTARHYEMSSQPVRYILGAPVYLYAWYRMGKVTKSMQVEIQDLKNLVVKTWAQEQELDKQAWLLASRVRAAIAKQEHVRQMMDYLGDQKLYGDTFDAMVEKEDLVIEAIEHIPEYFLLDGEESISTHAGKLDVWVVHKILAESEPVLNEMHEKLSLWITQYEKLAEKAEHHKLQLAQFEHLVKSAPQGLDLTPQKTQLIALGDTLKVLSATLTRLEVESIEAVDRELDQVQKIITETSVRIRQGYNDHTELQQLYTELTKEQADVSGIFELLLRSPTYPINWDHSNTPFREINKRVTALGNPDSPRTLEQLREDLNAIRELLESVRLLKSQIYRIKGIHEELLLVYASDEILHGLIKFQECYQLSDQISQYDLDNWGKADSPATYFDDIQNLESAHSLFLSRDPTKSIPESEIADWLQRGEDLVYDQTQLIVRSEKLHARLQFIKSKESEAKELFATVQNAFNQLNWLVKSNSYLTKIAANEIKKIAPQIAQAGAQIGEPLSGRIEDKYRNLQSVRDTVDHAGRNWLERLNQDIDQRISLLTEKLDVIANIASLDDPAISKAQRISEQLGREKESRQLAPAIQLQFEDIISNLKTRSMAWQELVAVQTELEEIVETPLIDAYNHTENQRKLALDTLAMASRIIPESRHWPPCSVSISDERMEMERLESVRMEIAGKKTRAIWAVRRYGELAASYQTLTGKIERARDWAMHEQKRINDLEREIGELNRRLQLREQSNTNDPETVEQYRRLRAQANLSLEREKQRWIKSTPGTPEAGDYEDTLHGLVETVRKLREAVGEIEAGGRTE